MAGPAFRFYLNNTNMKSDFWILVLLTATLHTSACRNRTKEQTPPANQEQTKSEPDNNDLLQTLQGRWRSNADSTYIIEFVDSKMRHINNDKLSFETNIEVDGSCSDSSCQGAGDTEDGWCFLEKGQFDVQCHLVLKCNPNELEFAAIGAANGMLSFRKIKG